MIQNQIFLNVEWLLFDSLEMNRMCEYFVNEFYRYNVQLILKGLTLNDSRNPIQYEISPKSRYCLFRSLRFESDFFLIRPF